MTDKAQATRESHKMYRTNEILKLDISPHPIGQVPQKHSRKHPNVDFVPPCNPYQRMVDFYNEWLYILQNYAKGITSYRFYVETGFYGKLHLHGTVKVSDPIKLSNFMFYLKYVNKVECKLERFDDPTIRKQYQTKDTDIIQLVITPKSKALHLIDYLGMQKQLHSQTTQTEGSSSISLLHYREP